MHTTPAGVRRPGAPTGWPFGRLAATERRRVAARRNAARAARVAVLPGALL